MNIDSTKGDKVKFTGENGSNYDQIQALKVLNVGQEYTVDKVEIGNWYSYVRLQGVNGRFNTAMFDDVKEKELDK